ncbi:MAG: type II toxin-antitoxin system VapC family toxin [Burkholderiales bacterium]
MILFCDTSALVKLYVREDGTDAVTEQVAACEVVAVSRIAWVEMMSALARRAREQTQDMALLAQVRQQVSLDWPRYLKVELTQPLLELAGDYAEAFALRAYDSVQLASAQTLHREMPGQVKFACFDSRLVKAAQVLGMG